MNIEQNAVLKYLSNYLFSKILKYSQISCHEVCFSGNFKPIYPDVKPIYPEVALAVLLKYKFVCNVKFQHATKNNLAILHITERVFPKLENIVQCNVCLKNNICSWN